MAIRNSFSTVDINCITVENLSPLTAASTVLQAFSVDVTTTGTVDTVTFNWGDGASDPGVAGVPPAYDASHTYATAGTFLVRIVVTLTTGETNGPDGQWFTVVVS